MPRHFLGLQDACTLYTADFRLAEGIVNDVADHHSIGLIYGDAGVGKTFAVDHAIKTLPIPTHRFDFPVHTTPRQLTARLLKSIAGVEPGSATQAELQDELLDVLSHVEVLLKIDEAQRLNHICVEMLRNLWDQLSSRLAILLVGGHGCFETINRYPMLRSRISGAVEFGPLEQAEVERLIPQFHPIYDGVDLALIRKADRVFAHGNLRNWTSLTVTATTLLTRSGQPKLDKELLDVTLAKLPRFAP